MSRIVGIDLGHDQQPRRLRGRATGLPVVIPDADGARLLPSIVASRPDGVVVGEAARRQLARRRRATRSTPSSG